MFGVWLEIPEKSKFDTKADVEAVIGAITKPLEFLKLASPSDGGDLSPVEKEAGAGCSLFATVCDGPAWG